MRLVHSFASQKCSEENFKMHMCYFILSCLYAKNSGFEIVLYCDKKTEDFLKIAPYDEIHPILEGIEWPANGRIYAWSKFFAMANEPLGSIHIDGDVFLKDPKLLEKLNFDNYDCIVQSLETPFVYGADSRNCWEECRKCFDSCEYPIWAKRLCNEMYNCGIVGINNQELKDEYFKTYWLMLERYNKTGIDIDSVPDIIIEQQFLKDLTDYKRYKVKKLLRTYEFQQDAINLGYQHLIGLSKMENLDRILKLIKKKDKNIYKKIMLKYYGINKH